MTYLIINASDNFVKKVIIGKFGICEFVEEWKKNIELYDNVFLQTKFKQYLWVRIKNPYTVEINGGIKNVWICQIISTDKLNELTGETVDENDKPEIECIKIIYARCVRSMKLLDVRHRKYIKKQNFSDNEIISIRSVAGSGKTTTLLDLAQKHKKKKILYLAFNKSLITEIKNKIHTKGITNLKPCTFDSLMRTTFIQHNEDPNIVYLKPQTIGTIHPWFEGKAYPIKKYYTNWFNKFCRQLEFDDIIKFCKHHLGKPKDLLITLWKKVLKNEFQTFDSIRKMVVMNNWCKEYIDNKYDMIFIDEAQDFDNLMLRILITDTTIPKLFVGDPKQAIYQWRGCINAFDHLPSHTLHVEFYSTFRLGELACEKIREIFPDCWIMSKSENTTVITYDTEPPESYVYLFRSWRGLLTSAKTLQDIWIYNYNKQIDFIRKLHNKLQFSDLSDDEKKEIMQITRFYPRTSCLPETIKERVISNHNNEFNKIEKGDIDNVDRLIEENPGKRIYISRFKNFLRFMVMDIWDSTDHSLSHFDRLEHLKSGITSIEVLDVVDEMNSHFQNLRKRQFN